LNIVQDSCQGVDSTPDLPIEGQETGSSEAPKENQTEKAATPQLNEEEIALLQMRERRRNEKLPVGYTSSNFF
jgi:hypothetical protein